MLDQTLPLRDLPITVIDFETTGLSPSMGCRVVEVSVVRLDPGAAPRLVLDTLIDPRGPVHATRIHGITDDDVRGAPVFGDVAGTLMKSLEGSVVCAFNASFDMMFLKAEMHLLGHRDPRFRLPPHLCLMWLRPLLGVGSRCNLGCACESIGLSADSHRAAEDSLAAAHLWRHYQDAAAGKGIVTLADLRRAGRHKYLSSLESPPYSSRDLERLGLPAAPKRLKPRSQPLRDPRKPAAGPSVAESTAAHVHPHLQALMKIWRKGG